MTANKHTPGPWEVAEKFNCVDVRGVDGPYIANCNQSVAIDWRTKEANARLIASAPELLEALSTKVKDAEQRVFEDWLESNSPSGDHEQVQRQWLESSDYRDFVAEWGDQLAAIAKATGGAA